MKRAVYLACFLAIVSALAGGVLALANSLTIDKINENKIATIKASLQVVYPDAEFQAIENYSDDTGKITGIYYAVDKGYIYKVTVDGFGGKGSIEYLIGFGVSNKVDGYSVIVCQETSGFGSQVAEDPFSSNIIGSDIGSEYDIITGSTVSSKAVIEGINVAVKHYEANYK